MADAAFSHQNSINPNEPIMMQFKLIDRKTQFIGNQTIASKSAFCHDAKVMQ